MSISIQTHILFFFPVFLTWRTTSVNFPGLQNISLICRSYGWIISGLQGLFFDVNEGEKPRREGSAFCSNGKIIYFFLYGHKRENASASVSDVNL